MSNAWSAVTASPSRKPYAGLTRRAILQAMIDGRLPAPPMARTLAFELVEVGDGFAAFEAETDKAFLNPMGTVHGGWRWRWSTARRAARA